MNKDRRPGERTVVPAGTYHIAIKPLGSQAPSATVLIENVEVPATSNVTVHTDRVIAGIKVEAEGIEVRRIYALASGARRNKFAAETHGDYKEATDVLAKPWS